jgi:outer membrane protein assembly factor BamD (BamD/ComL family)
MAAKRSYRETAARRPGGALGAAINRGEKAARTLPRDPASREALKTLGENAERLGPARAAR